MQRFFQSFGYSPDFQTARILRWVLNTEAYTPPQPRHTVRKSSWGVWCLGGCSCFSKAPDPSGALFDLGQCSPALEQPAQIQRCECAVAQSKRANQLFDLREQKYEVSVSRWNLKEGKKGEIGNCHTRTEPFKCATRKLFDMYSKYKFKVSRWACELKYCVVYRKFMDLYKIQFTKYRRNKRSRWTETMYNPK